MMHAALTPVANGSHCAGIGCAHEQPRVIAPIAEQAGRDDHPAGEPVAAVTPRHRRSTTGRRRVG
jgi:hypothetical protein